MSDEDQWITGRLSAYSLVLESPASFSHLVRSIAIRWAMIALDAKSELLRMLALASQAREVRSGTRGPVATCVGIDWRIFGRHEAIRSCGEVITILVSRRGSAIRRPCAW